LPPGSSAQGKRRKSARSGFSGVWGKWIQQVVGEFAPAHLAQEHPRVIAVGENPGGASTARQGRPNLPRPISPKCSQGESIEVPSVSGRLRWPA
jgi:hypothetical protein